MLNNQTLNGNLVAGDALLTGYGTVLTVKDTTQSLNFGTNVFSQGSLIFGGSGLNDTTISGTYTSNLSDTYDVNIFGTGYYLANITGPSPGTGNTATGSTSGAILSFVLHVVNTWSGTYPSDYAVFIASGTPINGETFTWTYPSPGSFVFNNFDVGPVDAVAWADTQGNSNGTNAYLLLTAPYTQSIANGLSFTVNDQTGHSGSESWTQSYTWTNSNFITVNGPASTITLGSGSNSVTNIVGAIGANGSGLIISGNTNGTTLAISDSSQNMVFTTTYNSVLNSTIFDIEGSTCYLKMGDVDGNGNDTILQIIDSFNGGTVHSKANVVSFGGSATLLGNQIIIDTAAPSFILQDSTITTSIDVENRALYDDTGTLQVMWTETGIRMPTLPAYADDIAAGGGGLVTGDFYQTTGSGAITTPGVVMIKQ
jgi:hypothetical protein